MMTYISSIAVLAGLWALAAVSDKVELLKCSYIQAKRTLSLDGVVSRFLYTRERTVYWTISCMYENKKMQYLLISTVTRGKYDVERNRGICCRSIDDTLSESVFTKKTLGSLSLSDHNKSLLLEI